MSNSLPAGWVHAPIEDLVQFNPKTNAPDELECGFVPMQGLGTAFLAPLKVQEPRVWRDVRKTYTHFKDGDVLVAKVTPCFENGKAGVAAGLPNGIGAGSSEFCVFRPEKGVDSRFLLGWFSTENFRRRAKVAMTGSVGLKRVPKDVFLGELLPLAPEPEQRRIADKLESVLARVDGVNERLGRVTPMLKRLRQSVLAAATSGKLTEEWRGGKAAEWLLERADLVCDKVQSGGTPKAGFSEAGVPFLKVYNIVNQKIAFDYKPQFVSQSVHLGELKKSHVQPGDVLMNIVGPPLGKVAIVPCTYRNWNINQAIAMFRPSATLSSVWIYIVLCEGAPIRKVLASTKGSVGQINISLSQCRAFEFPVPPPDEQTEIVRRVEVLFAYVDRLEAKLQAAQDAAQRLTPALLAKAFRGELVPQDPSDAPAIELLQQLVESKFRMQPIGKKTRKMTA